VGRTRGQERCRMIRDGACRSHRSSLCSSVRFNQILVGLGSPCRIRGRWGREGHRPDTPCERAGRPEWGLGIYELLSSSAFLSNVYGVGEKKETYDMVSGEGGTVERDQGGTEEG